MKTISRVGIASVLGWLAIALAGGSYVLPSVVAAEATCPSNCVALPRPGDELWIVSARAAGCSAAPLD
ncbi:MAG TPA: hypothetical protein VHY20_05580, partial [Pirellulales bacterium]|nr:hypothetical protein [Pirellulales bacterium]